MQRDGGNITVYASQTIFAQNHILENFNKCSSPPSHLPPVPLVINVKIFEFIKSHRSSPWALSYSSLHVAYLTYSLLTSLFLVSFPGNCHLCDTNMIFVKQR